MEAAALLAMAEPDIHRQEVAAVAAAPAAADGRMAATPNRKDSIHSSSKRHQKPVGAAVGKQQQQLGEPLEEAEPGPEEEEAQRDQTGCLLRHWDSSSVPGELQRDSQHQRLKHKDSIDSAKSPRLSSAVAVAADKGMTAEVVEAQLQLAHQRDCPGQLVWGWQHHKRAPDLVEAAAHPWDQRDWRSGAASVVAAEAEVAGLEVGVGSCKDCCQVEEGRAELRKGYFVAVAAALLSSFVLLPSGVNARK